jgi:hypothetical protein
MRMDAALGSLGDGDRPRMLIELNLMLAAGVLNEEQVLRIIERLNEQGHAMDLIDGRVVQTSHIHTVTTVTQGGLTGRRLFRGQFPEFRARGGPIRAGRPYIVGEEGPELVIPSGAGRVMSAPQTQSLLGVRLIM